MKFVLTLSAIAACSLACSTTPTKQDVKSAIHIADEACDVAVLLDDQAEYVCIPIEKLDAIAQLMRKEGAPPTLIQGDDASIPSRPKFIVRSKLVRVSE